jgi:hypothetical protein
MITGRLTIESDSSEKKEKMGAAGRRMFLRKKEDRNNKVA